MLKTNRGRSTARKPLVDISNGGKPSRLPKKKVTRDGDDGALDRLLLVRSDLSNLVSQIDEVVAQALEHNMMSRTASQDIESFRHLLSDMHLSLKPWVSRLQQSFGRASTPFVNQLGQPLETTSVSCADGGGNVAPDNKNEPELDLIVSPSPLVSWRAGACTLESGRQLFLLTPLPKPKILSSKCPGSSKSMAVILHDKDQHANLELPPSSFLSKNAHNDLSERMEAKLASSNVPKACTIGAKNNSTSESTFISPLKFSSYKCRKDSIFLSTPCLKTSPPKSSALLHLTSENIPKPTQNNESKGSDDLTNGEASESMASRYQQPFDLQPTYNFTTRQKEVDETLDWFLSPPKTCVLMEPSDEKPVPMPANNGGVLLATPMWMDVESTIQKGKQPGENTLKKELWTRFEAVSTDGLHFNASVFQKTTRKGFLDMLEEVSSETTDLDCKVTR